MYSLMRPTSLEVCLFPGELVIGQAHNVLKFDAFSGLNSGISGSLYCTNFKISFSTATKPSHDLVELDHKNLLYKENDIPLTSVEAVYQVSSNRRRLLSPNSTVSNGIKVLEIRCKNFKVHTFSFKFTLKKENKTIVNTILHHAFPKKLELLFAFSFQLPNSQALTPTVTNPEKNHSKSNGRSINLTKFFRTTSPTVPPSPTPSLSEERPSRTPQYRKVSDWEAEIKRTNGLNLRVTLANQAFKICDSLPEYFVIPMGSKAKGRDSLLDGDLHTAATHFEGGRVPFWSWSHSNGSMLIRMSPLRVDSPHLDQETRMLKIIQACHPYDKYPLTLDLNATCPSVKDIQSSFQKIRELCVPEAGPKKSNSLLRRKSLDPNKSSPAKQIAELRKETLKEFWNTDARWLSSVEATKWLQYIRACLSTAAYVATTIAHEQKSVVLKEFTGRDFSCVVSSLVQLMLDPYARTQMGFQSLVQREWVIAGHPFLTRCGHIIPSDGQESPIFLLFLDCVFQLMEQFPDVFEFTDTYLITLWDSTHIGVFGTFIFNNEKQRVQTCMRGEDGKTIKLPTVWAWTLQYKMEDLALFNNPLYVAKHDVGENFLATSLNNSIGFEDSMQLGCNPGVYRNSMHLSEQTASMFEDYAKMKRTFSLQPGRNKRTGNGAHSSGATFELPETEIDLIVPRISGPYIKLWMRSYLRWIPSIHIVGGGAPTQYQQQCKVVDEIQQLRDQVDQLQAVSPSRVVKRRSQFFFACDADRDGMHGADVVSSAFPFTTSDLSFIGGDRRSFIGTPLALFLRGQSLLDTDTSALEDLED
ncbi:myotubularin-related protein 10-B-like isoform X2 [Anneissia japonica]|uniref:myotubularin-related protein 10-B-like isoform X2 n=1 Tax=Anneissia japonica TaxID=1529436 RepID=UPI0014254C75|nr:myotubularin-related protein 10-B-like isoform X2 [Anneissia japonica]